jgi:structural maintenance of chromosome 2
VTRAISDNKVKCYIDGKNATQEDVRNLFASVKMNVNNPHFLIMQGHITKTINYKP